MKRRMKFTRDYVLKTLGLTKAAMTSDDVGFTCGLVDAGRGSCISSELSALQVGGFVTECRGLKSHREFVISPRGLEWADSFEEWKPLPRKVRVRASRVAEVTSRGWWGWVEEAIKGNPGIEKSKMIQFTTGGLTRIEGGKEEKKRNSVSSENVRDLLELMEAHGVIVKSDTGRLYIAGVKATEGVTLVIPNQARYALIEDDTYWGSRPEFSTAVKARLGSNFLVRGFPPVTPAAAAQAPVVAQAQAAPSAPAQKETQGTLGFPKASSVDVKDPDPQFTKYLKRAELLQLAASQATKGDIEGCQETLDVIRTSERERDELRKRISARVEAHIKKYK